MVEIKLREENQEGMDFGPCPWANYTVNNIETVTIDQMEWQHC
jgi:hypothetical protein